MKPGMMKIFTALTNERQGLKFTQLKNQVGLSNPVLSDYLATMQHQGVVVKEPRTRKYSLAKVYYPTEVFANSYQSFLKIFLATLPYQALKISEIDDLEKRKESFELFLDSSFSLFMLAIWKVIGESLVDISKKEDLKNQDNVIEINSVINTAFHDWIAPMANSLAISVASNLEIIDVADQFFKKIVEETSTKMALLKKLELT